MTDKMIQIDADTYRLEDDFVRCFLLIGKERALWLDSGAGRLDLPAIAAEYTSLPLMLLNTHGDGDHTANNGAFAQYYVHQADYEGTGMRDRFPESTCSFIQDRDVIDLGGRPLEIIAIPGHTRGSVAVLDRTKRRLYSGDTVQNGNIFLFGKHRAPQLFASALDKLAARKDDYDEIAASHGEPILEAGYAEKVARRWKQVCEG